MNDNTDDNEYTNFLELHKPQLEASSIPERHWKTLCAKLKNEIFDAGLAFSIAQVEEENDDESDSSGKQNMNYSWQVIVSCEDGIDPADPKHIYLIDHAWSYQLKHAKKQLQQIPKLLARMTKLLARMTSLMDVPDNPSHDGRSLLEIVLSKMWRYNQTYHIANLSTEDDDGLEPMWYIMDEFGSKIQHSHEPTVKTVPFFYVPARISFTLLWPVTELEEGDEVTRDFTGGIIDEDLRKARLLPWFENDLTNVNWRQEEPDIKYFEMYCQGETLPIVLDKPPRLSNSETIKVFTDITQLTTFLTDTRFEFTKYEDKAEIIWCKKVFKDFRSLSENRPNCFVNQFPSEMLLTVKDALAVVARRVVSSSIGSKYNSTLETEPSWLPTTFNLVTELPKFVSYFQQREKESLDNHWILKPWNMARAVDTHICSDVDTTVRLAESIPKVACKYIEQPVLFLREEIGWVKFDIRYIVLLSSTNPLELYAFRVFWLRFANKEYSLANLDDYETHFTVMNYKDDVQLKQIHYDEFISMFEKQYPDFKWSDVEKKIFTMFKELFGAACTKPPPLGIPVSPQSRAMYAIDLMLDWAIKPNGEKVMEPKLCEVNYCPDCERACKYHPHFYNDVFSTLFLGDTDDRPVTLL